MRYSGKNEFFLDYDGTCVFYDTEEGARDLKISAVVQYLPTTSRPLVLTCRRWLYVVCKN